MNKAPGLRLSIGFVLLLTAGCETTNNALNSAEKILSNKNVKSVTDVATSKDPSSVLKKRAESYKYDPAAAIRDLKSVQADFARLMDALTGNVRRTWGKNEVKLPQK